MLHESQIYSIQPKLTYIYIEFLPVICQGIPFGQVLSLRYKYFEQKKSLPQKLVGKNLAFS